MSEDDIYAPLSRDEIIRAVEGRFPSRIPLVRAKWWGEGLREQYGDELDRFDKYPEDVVQLWMPNPADPREMDLPWEWDTGGAHDARCALDDWAKLDEFIERIPEPDKNEHFLALCEAGREARKQDRYVQLCWWRLFFEMPWGLRGMQNLMTDYYVAPEMVHRLHAALCDTYCAYIERAAQLFQPDGFWSSDDLGHQTGPMMSPRTFHELIYPYYQRVGATVHRHGMHFWLHSCGDNTLLLPDLIAAGLDVFHPVQKHTMDEVQVMREFGGKLSFLVGIDVQHTLQEKDPDGVRQEVRFLIDTFDLPEGRMCIAAGNGIVAGTPIANIEAFLDEALRYGIYHRQQHNRQRNDSCRS